MQEAGEVQVDAAAFTVAMRDANIDKEFSGRLFEFLDVGARAVTRGQPKFPPMSDGLLSHQFVAREALGTLAPHPTDS